MPNSRLSLQGLRKKASVYNPKINAKYVAKKLGITTRALYDKESGTSRIWDTELREFKKLYNVSYEELESAILESRKRR